jgi:4-amino-4-deoxy-L-arabinose transferase-like glycosyltransferase
MASSAWMEERQGFPARQPSPVASPFTDALRRWWPAALLLCAAFAIRGYQFGNPVLDYDEQLYLYVGDRMLHGQIPYVDLWDRKPLGLFVLYALIRLLGGVGIVQYQVVATLFAGATAILIQRIARRSTGQWGAIAAGLGYLLWLKPFHGEGGQAAVFYNLLTAIAVWSAFRANASDDTKHITRLGLVAMAMSGLAIQLKYVPVVEGMFFGCWFLWRLWQSGATPLRLLGIAASYILVALLPSIAAVGWYAATGHLDAFVQANILSIFQRQPMPASELHIYRIYIGVTALPLALCLPFALVRRWREGPGKARRDFAFLTGWLIAAFCGFGLLGDIYASYFLPMLLPLWIALAPLFESRKRGIALACALAAWSLWLSPLKFQDANTARAASRQLVEATAPYVHAHCLFVFDGPTAAYTLTQACAPTRFVYADHLNRWMEARAIGVDPVAEVRRILATRPGAIITADRSLSARPNEDTRAIMSAALSRDYVTVAAIRFPDRTIFVHALRTLHPGPASVTDPKADTAA